MTEEFLPSHTPTTTQAETDPRYLRQLSQLSEAGSILSASVGLQLHKLKMLKNQQVGAIIDCILNQCSFDLSSDRKPS